MYKHILLATDGSELSARAAAEAIRLSKALAARLTVVTVAITPAPTVVEGVVFGPSDEERAKIAKDQASRHLEDVSNAARKAGVRCDLVPVIDQQPYRAIIETASARTCDLIVMASHGRSGLKALLLGSETQKVLAHSKIPVLVHR